MTTPDTQNSGRKHRIRTKDGGTIEIDNYTRAKAIKLMCTECCGHGELHPKECNAPLCPLYPFRGKMLSAYHKGEETT